MTSFWRGVGAIARKEALHMLRDRLTLALVFGVPLVQVLLFGYAINLHPKSLPTAMVAYEQNALVDQTVKVLESDGNFRVTARTSNPEEANRWLAESRVQFVLRLPPNLRAGILRGERPEITLIADATDPVASTVAIQSITARFSQGERPSPVRLRVERRFNPEGLSRVFIVPGLLGVILTLSLVLLGALSFVRERERGTFELLAILPMPRSAVITGKLLPYFVLGCGLFTGLLGVCVALLGLPWPHVSVALLMTVAAFIAANLSLGIALSLLARSQMQAMQLGVFFYLPSMLLSGFMFPFFGMPRWARILGELLPLTHFLRVVRGVLLKDMAASSVWGLAWPIAVFALGTGLAALALFRRRL